MKEVPVEDVTEWVRLNADGSVTAGGPITEGVAAAVAHHNRRVVMEACQALLEESAERVRHFRGRMAALRVDPRDCAIVFLSVDDPLGGAMAEALMPGTDWSPIRARGEAPYARGLVLRVGLVEGLRKKHPAEAEKLAQTEGVVAVVVAHGVVLVASVAD